MPRQRRQCGIAPLMRVGSGILGRLLHPRLGLSLCIPQASPRPYTRQVGMTSSANRRRERSVCSLVSVPKQKEPTK